MGVEEISRGADRFACAIQASGRAVAHPDPEQAIGFAYRMIIAMSARWTAHEVETQAPAPMAWIPMLDELSMTVARYLFGSSLAPPHNQPDASYRERQ